MGLHISNVRIREVHTYAHSVCSLRTPPPRDVSEGVNPHAHCVSLMHHVSNRAHTPMHTVSHVCTRRCTLCLTCAHADAYGGGTAGGALHQLLLLPR
eukprot:1546756-Rhodomonas_salina.2